MSSGTAYDTMREITIIYLTILHIICIATAGGPPQLNGSYQKDFTLTVNESLHLQCPVEASPQPHYAWKKDGKLLMSGFGQMKVKGNSLQIKQVQIEDSGEYQCAATNGFGTKILHFSVCIIENSTLSEKDQKHCASAPTLLEHHHLSEEVKLKEGASTRLSCHSNGNPKPTVTWLKDGKPWGAVGQDSAVITLIDVTMGDSGKYTCLVSNTAGNVNHTFNVIVNDIGSKKPVFIPTNTLNVNATKGERAELHCQVYSNDDRTQIQWLKLISNFVDVKKLNLSTEKLTSDQFVVLNGEETRQTETNHVYISSLVVDSVKEKDEGVYVCLAVNVHGFNTQPLVLHVLSDKSGSGSQSVDMVTIIAVVGSITGLALISLVIFMIKRRCQSDEDKSHPHSNSSPSTDVKTNTTTPILQYQQQPNKQMYLAERPGVPGYPSVPPSVDYSHQMAQQPLMNGHHQPVLTNGDVKLTYYDQC